MMIVSSFRSLKNKYGKLRVLSQTLQITGIVYIEVYVASKINTFNKRVFVIAIG